MDRTTGDLDPSTIKKQKPFNAEFTNCTATNRNGEFSFQVCFKAKYQNFFSVLIWLKIQVQTNKEGAATMHDYSVNARVTFKTDTSS